MSISSVNSTSGTSSNTKGQVNLAQRINILSHSFHLSQQTRSFNSESNSSRISKIYNTKAECLQPHFESKPNRVRFFQMSAPGKIQKQLYSTVTMKCNCTEFEPVKVEEDPDMQMNLKDDTDSPPHNPIKKVHAIMLK